MPVESRAEPRTGLVGKGRIGAVGGRSPDKGNALGTDGSTVRSSPDGRIARGERTRRAIAEAMISLLEDGQEAPPARLIAKRAGVSLRVVFHHFEDVESILRAAVAIQAQRHWTKITPVDAAAPLDTRIRSVIRQRDRLYEAIAPVRRAACALEAASPVVSRELAHSRATLRRQLDVTFEPELSAATSRRPLLDALDVTASFEAWEGLRRMGRSTSEAKKVMELTFVSLLEGARPARPKEGRR